MTEQRPLVEQENKKTVTMPITEYDFLNAEIERLKSEMHQMEVEGKIKIISRTPIHAICYDWNHRPCITQDSISLLSKNELSKEEREAIEAIHLEAANFNKQAASLKAEKEELNDLIKKNGKTQNVMLASIFIALSATVLNIIGVV